MTRLFDFSISVTVLQLLMLGTGSLLLSLLVRVSIGLPIFLTQRSSVLHGTALTMIKVCTMTNATTAEGALLLDAECTTHCGNVFQRHPVGLKVQAERLVS